MIWGKTDEEQKNIEKAKDARWFAWHPVKLKNGRWVWLERVARTLWGCWDGGYYEYKEISNEQTI